MEEYDFIQNFKSNSKEIFAIEFATWNIVCLKEDTNAYELNVEITCFDKMNDDGKIIDLPKNR